MKQLKQWVFWGMVAASLVGAPACGDSAASREDTPAESAAALRPLEAGELLGRLAYGETSAPVAYNEKPRYRAFEFSGTTGDAVKVAVRSTNGHARAWILGADYSNLVYANADGATTNAEMELTLPTTSTYYIVFRDAFQEEATFTVSLTGPRTTPPVPPTAPCDPETSNCTTPVVVRGSVRTWFTPREAWTESWGAELWSGYVSFSIEANTSDLVLEDGSGATYPIVPGKPATAYARLPTPVTLRGGPTPKGTLVVLSNPVFEINEVRGLRTLQGKFYGVDTTKVTTLGHELVGVGIEVVASVRFFKNFTNGGACGRLAIGDQFVEAAAPTRTLSLTGPADILTAATCVSSRLAAPENGDADFALDFSNIRFVQR